MPGEWDQLRSLMQQWADWGQRAAKYQAGPPRVSGFNNDPIYNAPPGGWTPPPPPTRAPPPNTANHFALTPEEMTQLHDAAGLKGQAFLDALPAPIKPTGVTPSIIDAYNQADAAYRANPSDTALRDAAVQAGHALQTAQYGPLWQLTGPILEPNNTTGGAPMISPLNWNGFVYTPQAKPQKPLTLSEAKVQAAASLGYGNGQKYGVQGFSGAMPNILQTLKSAGWDPSMGYGQQDWAALGKAQGIDPSSLDSVNQRRTSTLNNLLFAASPRPSPPAPTTTPPPPGPRPQDPWEIIQGAIDRRSYNDITMGGNYYGGVVPEQSGQTTDPWETLNQMGIQNPNSWNSIAPSWLPQPNVAQPRTQAGASFSYDTPWGAATGQNQPQTGAVQSSSWKPSFGSSPWGSPWGKMNGSGGPWG